MKNLKTGRYQNRQSALIPRNKRTCFFDKQGNLKYLMTYPTTMDGKVIKDHPKTYCGGLGDSVGFNLTETKVNNNLKNLK